jgi:membrane fusion protein (multidrug efflux system)
MNIHQGVQVIERESLIVRIRQRPLGQQIALAAAAVAVLLLVAWLLFGRAAPPPPAPGPTPVGVIVVREEPVALTAELPGRTSPYETSDVRPQVDGIIRARLFTEGDYVRAGQPLYRIDPASYEARVSSARAALARARASTIAAEGQVKRYAELVKRNFVSRQLYDNALSAAGEARADVEAQAAALRSAQIDLDRTTIRAPISGRIGRSLYTTGALVQAGQENPLTTIQRLDPIYVDIQQSSSDLLRLREQTLSGQVTSDKAPVRLQLESGSAYPLTGTLSFADVTVDPATGSQAIRAVFPNPQHILLPGMFVRGEISQGVQTRGILVAQRAVNRDERGRPTVLVVGAKGMSELRVVQADRTVGDDWLVTGGLKTGEKVIVDAGPLVRPGIPVKPQLTQSK